MEKKIPKSSNTWFFYHYLYENNYMTCKLNVQLGCDGQIHIDITNKFREDGGNL